MISLPIQVLLRAKCILSLISIFIFCFLYIAYGLEDGCLTYYGFENESDIPESSDGWHFNNQSYSGESSYISGEASQSILSINENGPFNVNFHWKKSEIEIGKGLFLFVIDDEDPKVCDSYNWTREVGKSEEAGPHTLKWIVSKGKNEKFSGWIDALCIKRIPCSKSCPKESKQLVGPNQIPIISNLIADKSSPREVGAIINWTAESFDPESDPLLFRFLLNDKQVQDWSSSNAWTWIAREIDIGQNLIEVQIRDGNHYDAGGFDSRKLVSFTIASIEAPKTPEMPIGPDEGYNCSLYCFSTKSQEVGSLNYTFDWGDGETSHTGLVDSNKPGESSHKWRKAATFNIKVMATDERGINSNWSQPNSIRISWLVKVPKGALLEPIINRTLPNTTILLEGIDYDGPLNITEKNYINISSNITGSELRLDELNPNFVIGLKNSNNIILNNLKLTSSYGIALIECSYCQAFGNEIHSNTCGIHVMGGHDNSFKGNNITISDNTKRFLGGIHLEDSTNDLLTCNTIRRNNMSRPSYYLKNSTLKQFIIKNESLRDTLIISDPSTTHIINENECCCRFIDGNLSTLNCSLCQYENKYRHGSSCSCNLRVETC